MKSTKILALLLVVVMCFGMLSSCFLFPKKCDGHVDANSDGKCDNCGAAYDDGKVTYNTYTSTMPSNWNELNYSDNNDTQIMSYIGSSFFSYDYKFEGGKFKEDGSINKEGIVPGAFVVNYSAATKLEDVTATVDAKWGYTDEQKADGGYAWKITLRDDLKWDDGTPITAADFEYSMKAQLDPAFMNFRANTYYDTLKVKNSRAYFFQNQEGTYESVASLGYEKNDAAIADGKVILVNLHDFWGAAGAPKITSYDETTFKPVLDFDNTCPQWVAYDDNTYYFDYGYFASEDATAAYLKEDGSIDFDALLAFNETAEDGEKIDLTEFFFSAAMVYGAYGSYFEVGADYSSCVGIYVENTIREVAWEDVGMYAIESENAIVVCLDKPYALLNKDGSLGIWAAYYMSSLPLVKKDLYEKCIKEPAAGATLYTTNYNSSLATTASWGPYKLVEFEAGSHYKLEKNPYWYGWNMEDNKNQYNIDAIYCRNVEEFTTAWMSFLSGEFDDSSLQAENIDEYADSKYVSFSPGTGTFGMQLYSNLNVLKNSENNNGILAIQEFRHALSLSLNRNDLVEKIWPGTATPCLGIVNSEYFYDIENSTTLADNGIYRNTIEAKEGLLRAYGFTQGEDGKWSTGSLTNLTLDEAYDALTGYNPALAKEKMKAAIEILNADPEHYGYDATKEITIVYGSSVDNAKQKDRCAYLQGVVDELTKDTALEGKIKLKFDASAGSQWAEAFRSGATQIGFGYGFGGNPFNPFSNPGLFVDTKEDLNYHQYWNTSAVNMTLTLPEGDYEGAGETITMPLDNWYYCLNGLAEEYKQTNLYNWDAGFAPVNARLTIFAALEEQIIKESLSVMLIGESNGSFLGGQFDEFSDEYNTFMGFGGLRYMEVKYTDAQWNQYVKDNNGDLSSEYKKSE